MQKDWLNKTFDSTPVIPVPKDKVAERKREAERRWEFAPDEREIWNELKELN